MTVSLREDLLTADDVAEQIDMSKQFVYLEAKRGRLSHVRRGRLFFFTQDNVAEYQARCEHGAGKPAGPPPEPTPEDATPRVVHVTNGRSFNRAVDGRRLVSDHECIPDLERDFVLAVAGVPPELWRHDDTWVCRLVSGTGVYAFVRPEDYAVGFGPGFDWQRVLIVRAVQP